MADYSWESSYNFMWDILDSDLENHITDPDVFNIG